MLYSRKNHSRERGQALAEYAPTFPAVIAILIISATTISAFLEGAFRKAVDGLNGVSVCSNTDESREGPAVAMVGPHRISLIGVSYNAADDTTSIVYRVESLDDPSISHWTLGISNEVAQAIRDTSEMYEWTNSDPTTGLAGIKFDTGYESAGGSGGGNNNGGGANNNGGGGGNNNNGGGNGNNSVVPTEVPTEPTNNNNGGGGNNNGGGNGNNSVAPTEVPTEPSNNNGKGGGKKSGAIPLTLDFAKRIDKGFSQSGSSTTYTSDPLGTSRDIFILLAGQYEFQQTTVTIKAGTNVYTGSISAPVPQVTVTEKGC